VTIFGIFLINQIRTGGDRDYIELLELLAERGNKVYVILNSFLEYKPKFIIPIYLSIKYIRHRLPPASYLFKKNIKKYLKNIIENFNNDSPCFIHIHGDIYLKSAIFLKKQLNIPLFYASRLNDISKAILLRKYKAYTVKEYIYSILYENIRRYREKQIAKHSDIICFLNPTDKDIFLSRTYSKPRKGETSCVKNNVIIIPNHIGLPHFTDETKNKNNSKNVSRIVYAGSLSPAKGLWDLLKAAAILKNEGFELFYFILGRKENEKRTLKLIEKLNLNENISIEGFTSPFPFFIKCDLFVYPTLYDDFGNVVTEALHCGCPVFASKSTGPSFILQHEELLFELGAPSEIAVKIKKCIIDNDYYQKIRSLCAERTEHFHFDWAEKFETAMKDYLQKK